MEVEQRQFRADPCMMKRLRVAKGMTAKELREITGLDRTTVAKILRGDPVLLKSIAIAANVFNVNNALDVLHPEELQAMGAVTEVPDANSVLEWRIEEYLSGWEKTSNGLQFQLTRLRHRFLENRAARGKCYELRHLAGAERERAECNLLRHAEVCEKIGHSNFVALNLTAAKVGSLWWVMDQWEDGITLAERLESGPLEDYELKVVMTGIAKGLEAIHNKKIVRRELSPKSILIRDIDDRPVLTDLELAKLSEAKPTVSPTKWPDDPYRALEVEGQVPVDARADIYSWGRIFVHAASGNLPVRGDETLERDLPARIKDVVMQAVCMSRSNRPADIAQILKALKGWV